MKLFKVYIISILSLLILISCVKNYPPEIPSSPDGPTSGCKYESITFKASTTDPDGDNISYQFDWGDGSLSLWSDYIPSGDTISMNHTYTDTGMLEIRVRAKDNFRLSPIDMSGEHTSDWSSSHLIRIIETDTIISGYPNRVVGVIPVGTRPMGITHFRTVIIFM